jgi:hypothetical protein
MLRSFRYSLPDLLILNWGVGTANRKTHDLIVCSASPLRMSSHRQPPSQSIREF